MDLDKLLIRSVERGASDLHLKPNSPPVLRIHGRLVPQPDLGVVSIGEMEDMARHILSERTYGQLKDGREVDVAYAVRDHGRFRVNLFLATGYIRAVMRAIPSKKPKFEELGLPQVLEKLAMERRGMVLVTGITGSGKSTTLAAMIDFINRNRNDHIITIEDPIEFSHEDINCVVSQREIGHDSSNFASALRAALREDPDVILVGEMRDPETMAVALHAAETGHLVFSTLHTLHAAETVNRNLGTFPPRQQQPSRDPLADELVVIAPRPLSPARVGEVRFASSTSARHDWSRPICSRGVRGPGPTWRGAWSAAAPPPRSPMRSLPISPLVDIWTTPRSRASGWRAGARAATALPGCAPSFGPAASTRR